MDPETTRQLRLGSTIRGLIIAALIGFYGFVMDQPGASLTAALLIAAGLQLAVLVTRRLVAADAMPQAMYLLELLVDAATVFLFALGVFGGVFKVGYDT